MSLTKNKLQTLVTVVFLGLVGWWASFQHIIQNQSITTQWFGSTYGFLALIGAIVGFLTARKWGGFKTVLGKALMFFSLGLFAQEAGQLIYAYYIYVSKIQIPYPSWGDVAYFGSTLSYLCGGIFLTKAVGIKFSLKEAKYKVVAVAIPAVLLLVTYLTLFYHQQYEWDKPVVAFLNVAYPVGDAMYVSLAFIAYFLSRKMLGGIMRKCILILTGALVLQFIADFTFLYQGTRGTYLTGKYDDLFYLITYFVTTTAMIQFNTTYKRLKSSTSSTSQKPTSPKQEAA